MGNLAEQNEHLHYNPVSMEQRAVGEIVIAANVHPELQTPADYERIEAIRKEMAEKVLAANAEVRRVPDILN